MSRAEEAEVLRRYLPLIEAYFRSRVFVHEDAEDCAQEAAAAVIRSWPRFERRSAVATWVYAICRNTLCAFYRRRGRMLPSAALEEAAEELPARAPSADQVDHLAVELALQSMEPLPRRLYELYYGQGLPVREIAALLGKPEGTVKYELYLLRARFRRMLT